MNLKNKTYCLKPLAVFFQVTTIASAVILLTHHPVYAYIGLGALIPAIGYSLTFIFFLVVMFVGVFAYPLKKFFGWLKSRRNSDLQQVEGAKGTISGKPQEIDTSTVSSDHLRTKRPFVSFLSEIEEYLIGDRAVSEIDRPIFVCGLARSGTTLLTEMLNSHPDTGSFLYRDHPFVRLPYFWSFLHSIYYFGVKNKPRIHGDQINVGPDSPDAFEEQIWMDHLDNYFEKDHFEILPEDYSDSLLERDLSGSIRKILFVRGKKTRYLSKGNYNLLRLPYIAKLFPQAKFVVCFRNPIDHCRSLTRVHQRFNELAKELKSFNKKLKSMGHFEFGHNRKPIKISQAEYEQTLQYWNGGDDYSGYLCQWISIYTALLDEYLSQNTLAEKIALFHYDHFIKNTEAEFQALLSRLKLDCTKSLINESMKKITLSPKSEKRENHTELEDRALELYKNLSALSLSQNS